MGKCFLLFIYFPNRPALEGTQWGERSQSKERGDEGKGDTLRRERDEQYNRIQIFQWGTETSFS